MKTLNNIQQELGKKTASITRNMGARRSIVNIYKLDNESCWRYFDTNKIVKGVDSHE